MPKPEREHEAEKYKEAKLQFVWAPLITAFAGLVTAVVLHFITDSKLGNASANFSRVRDTITAMQVEQQANRQELDRLERLVDQLLDNLLAHRDLNTPAKDQPASPPVAQAPAHTAEDAPTKPPQPAPQPAPVEKAQTLKEQITAARSRTAQQLQLQAMPPSLFGK